jgi:hypothetical protein
LNSSYNAFIEGNSLVQCGHHGVQKYSIAIRPCRSERLIVVPLRSGSENGGAMAGRAGVSVQRACSGRFFVAFSSSDEPKRWRRLGDERPFHAEWPAVKKEITVEDVAPSVDYGDLEGHRLSGLDVNASQRLPLKGENRDVVRDA